MLERWAPFRGIFQAALILALAGCGGSSVKTDYVLAESLWQQQNYQAAARQFERVFQKDPKGRLGHQALFRSAMTHYLFLKKYSEAVAQFRRYLEVAPPGPASRDAQLQLGEIFYSKTNQYESAIQHYRKWLQENPTAPEKPEFLYRIGRSQFFLWRFEEAIKTFESVLLVAPQSALAPESAYQIGMAHLSLAAQSRRPVGQADPDDEEEVFISPTERYRLAIRSFEVVEQRYPASSAAQQAALGIVTAHEEQGRWEDALKKLGEMGERYPIPQILKIRTIRIQERLAKKTSIPKR